MFLLDYSLLNYIIILSGKGALDVGSERFAYTGIF